MDVRPGRSLVGDLAFRVYGRVVHPDWLDTRAFARIAQTGWDVDARIIAGGHAISWSSGDARIVEILSTADLSLPESGVLYRSSVRRERSVLLTPLARVEYQSCFEAERLDPEVFAHLSEEIALDPTRGDLFFRDRPSNRMAPAPLSRLHFEPRRRGLAVQAFHTFPEELAIVRVQSLFEVVA